MKGLALFFLHLLAMTVGEDMLAMGLVSEWGASAAASAYKLIVN